MSNSAGDTFLGVVTVMFVFSILCLLVIWTFSYNLPYAKWKCVDEVQVGDDITNHECITYKRREVK